MQPENAAIAAGQSPQAQTRNAQRAAARRRRRRRAWRNRALFVLAVLALAALLVLVSRVAPYLAWQLLGANAAAPTPSYDLTGYSCDPADPLFVLVNANLPLEGEAAPQLAVADEAAGIQLQTEAAAAWQAMAQAAAQQGIALVLHQGYLTGQQADALHEQWCAQLGGWGRSAQQAQQLAAAIEPAAGANEHQTGLAADILSEDYGQADTGFARTEAFAWLQAHAAGYGFILRYPEQRQAATGMAYQPWHWRYVGVQNARAIAASGLALEEFLALEAYAAG